MFYILELIMEIVPNYPTESEQKRGKFTDSSNEGLQKK
jgi:hypothetical protein